MPLHLADPFSASLDGVVFTFRNLRADAMWRDARSVKLGFWTPIGAPQGPC